MFSVKPSDELEVSAAGQYSLVSYLKSLIELDIQYQEWLKNNMERIDNK
jgi:hypothetical protein